MSSVSSDPADQPVRDEPKPTAESLQAKPQEDINGRITGDDESQNNATDNDSDKSNENNESNKDNEDIQPVEIFQETPLHAFLRSLEASGNRNANRDAPDNASASVKDEAVDAIVDITEDVHHDNTGDIKPESLSGAVADDEVIHDAGATVEAATHTADTATANDPVPVEVDILPAALEKDLISHINVRSDILPRQTPLHIAVDKGLTKITRRLLGAGADVNAKDDNDVQPLHIAVDNVDTDLIKLLLSQDARTNGPDRDGWTLLHYASSYEQDPEIFQRLLALDRDFIDHAENFTHWTPLNRATCL
ncbi:Ankyrin repeat and protein kinase domain-containing protein 1 [Colletotrichum sp. SAR 10_65]|nr:Ankyrin repeat and protein kinase domain-containing protein 1 [Colletotrichum sp. SAR 10_65]